MVSFESDASTAGRTIVRALALEIEMRWMARARLPASVRANIDRIRSDAIMAGGSSYSLAQRRAWLGALVRGDGGAGAQCVVTARVEGIVVGYTELDFPGEHMSGLFVDPPWQRAAIGSSLFRVARSLARERRCSSLGFSACPDAIGFYGKCGCRRINQSTVALEHEMLPCVLFEIALGCAASRSR